MFNLFKKQEKGVGGLSLLIEGVAMIFVVGLLVMVLAITGGQMKNTTTDANALAAIANTTTSIITVPQYFTTIITVVIAVVLILLISLIIMGLRSSGLMGGMGGA